MNAATANLVGITGITRRLVIDGVLTEVDARRVLDEASKAKKQAHLYLLENRMVTTAQIAAANSTEFGMPLFDGIHQCGLSALLAAKLRNGDQFGGRLRVCGNFSVGHS